MTYSDFLANTSTYVADTSFLINLNATSFSLEIIDKMKPSTIIITQQVYDELRNGTKDGYNDFKNVEDYISKGFITLKTLSPNAYRLYEKIVLGEAQYTLDDGEASVIACAIDLCASAIIDEKKATRICREQYPDLKTFHTLDIFKIYLNKPLIQNATQNALKGARMYIPKSRYDELKEIVGNNFMEECSCISHSN